MFDNLLAALADFTDLFRNQKRPEAHLVVPAIVLVLTWPMFMVLFYDEAAAFMSAFVLAMAVRLAMTSEKLVVRMYAIITPRGAAALVLLTWPTILALLIWKGDPSWCQHFLTMYFLMMAGLYGLDVVDGAHAMVRSKFPGLVLPRAEHAMAQVLVIYHLGMVLLNETLIAHADQSVWLIYFGLMPLVSRIILDALYETVRSGYQGYSG